MLFADYKHLGGGSSESVRKGEVVCISDFLDCGVLELKGANGKSVKCFFSGQDYLGGNEKEKQIRARSSINASKKKVLLMLTTRLLNLYYIFTEDTTCRKKH